MRVLPIVDNFNNEYRVYQPSLGKALHRISQDIVRFGYFYWSKSKFPSDKDPNPVISKLAVSYGVVPCRTKRQRMKKRGLETAHIVFWDNYLFVFSNSCEGTFAANETFYDVRSKPIPVMCYTVGFKHGKPWIQMSLERYLGLRKKFRVIALKEYSYVQGEYDKISPFTYRGIIEQELKIRRRLNSSRKAAGLPRVVHQMKSSGKAECAPRCMSMTRR